MLFTPAGLEQACRLAVAAVHAERFRSAGLHRSRIWAAGSAATPWRWRRWTSSVTAVERDEVTAAVAAYNLAPWTNATVVHGDAADFDATGFDGVYLDPARRDGTRRLSNPADWSPSLDTAFGFAATLPTGVKLAPGMDRSLIPDDAEAQWVSVDREVVEVSVWFGVLARPSVRRSALLLGGQGAAELSAAGDSEDAEVGPLGEYVYEPDGAVIRARLIGEVARHIGASMLSDRIAYLTSDTRRGHAVRDPLPGRRGAPLGRAAAGEGVVRARHRHPGDQEAGRGCRSGPPAHEAVPEGRGKRDAHPHPRGRTAHGAARGARIASGGGDRDVRGDRGAERQEQQERDEEQHTEQGGREPGDDADQPHPFRRRGLLAPGDESDDDGRDARRGIQVRAPRRRPGSRGRR